MQIRPQNNISFKAISLNKDEKQRVDNLLTSIENPVQKEQVTLELFNIFDKHLQKEAKVKAGQLFYQEDFLSKLYLTFLESLENIKSITTEKLLEILNNTKPNREDIKEKYRFGLVSIDKKRSYDDDRTIESTLSEENVLIPMSQASPEEREKQLNKIQNLSESLSQKEQDLLNRRADGRTYQKIGDELGVSYVFIHRRIKTAIAKIQLANGVKLPEEYESFAQDFIKTFDLSQSKQDALNFILEYPELMACKVDTLNSNVEKSSDLFKIDKALFVKAALKSPRIFYQKPETIYNNISTTAELLDIDIKSLTKAALKHPGLFCQKPETIYNNISTTAELLDIDIKSLTEVALKHPNLFAQKPETIFNNIVKLSDLLDVDKKSVTKAALKQPSLFYQKPETIFNNIVKLSELLEVDKKSVTKAALKGPNLFGQKPETLLNNIVKLSDFLEVDKKSVTKAALRHPSLFYQKPETIFNNIVRLSQLLEVDKKFLNKAALRQPNIFHQKPETLLNNIVQLSKLLEVDTKLLIKTGLEQPNLFFQKPETLCNNIEITAKLLEIDRKTFVEVCLKSPQLMYYNPKTIINNIDTISKYFGIDRNVVISKALNTTALLHQAPETVIKKANIDRYYKQIQGKDNSEITFSLNADKTLYCKILSYLIKRNDGLKRIFKENELVDYLKSQNKVYNLEIPPNELAEEFIQFSKDFSQDNLGKQIFNIVVK